MSTPDQCPSTKGKLDIPQSPERLASMSGRPVWRSVEEFAGDPSFKDFVEREFPGGASLLEESSRRSFMKVMGASMALAGAATLPGCRRPDRKILAYSKTVPEEVIAGRPLYFATALPLPGGGAEGLLIETHTGRPTKVEGNPLHPNNRGGTSAFAQACVLDLYDPDRLKFPVYDNPSRGKLAATWADFKVWGAEHFSKFDRNGGAGLAFIADKQTSPTRERMRRAVLERWPGARWVSWNPAERRGRIDGTRLAFGGPHRVRYRFEKATRVLSVGSDFVEDGPDHVFHARGFAGTRKLRSAGDAMSRLYVVESRPTPTGAMADHRFRLTLGQMPAFLGAIARNLGLDAPEAPVPGIPAEHIAAMAADLAAHRGSAVVAPGENLPAEAYALAMAINAHLGALDGLVELFPMDENSASDAFASLAGLTDRLNAGEVDTLVVIEANPVYDAPGSMRFAEAFLKAPTRVTLSVGRSETELLSTWSLNGCHPLEAWGDVVSTDGTLSVVQPTIAPLFEPAMSAVELLGFLSGQGLARDLHDGQSSPVELDGYALVSATWAERAGVSVDSEAFTTPWRRALHDGLLAGSEIRPAPARLRMMDVTRAFAGLRPAPTPGDNALEVEFYTIRHNDGRSANNPWIQELPEFGPSVVWDNPVYLSPRTAESLGLLPEHTRIDKYNPYTKQQMPQARLATLTVGGERMVVAVWILPGMADHAAAIKLGYGRAHAGQVGDKVGFNSYAVKPAGLWASAAKLERLGGTYTIASTQNHWSLSAKSESAEEDRRETIVRAVDKKWWDLHGGTVALVPDQVYGTDVSRLNMAERLGELSHTPPNISSYPNPFNETRRDPAPDSVYSRNPQWGMSIDLNACSGCAVCTVACQSENNIPVVGKSEVAKGREMTWIRVDRYFVGEDLNNPEEMLVQPVACLHCENAPCETVCPVTATVHGPEGTNNMAYNRCIGTRYCANNCPYKVRRFNYFEYAPTKFRGGLNPTYVSKPVAEKFEETLGEDRTFNQNFIPPRLREKVDEITKMHFNPHVTVRSRGVMEKCSYCIQRVNMARQDVKIKGIWKEADQVGPIPDGFFQVACQQACPTGAITFGDVLDPSSKVAHERASGRTYMLLGYLNTRPRTTHMMRVRNPNADIHVYDQHDPLVHGVLHDEHGPEGGEGGEGEGHGSEPSGHGGAHSAAYIDGVKKHTDRGYSLSLRVLGVTV